MMGKKEEIFELPLNWKKTTKPRKSTRLLTTVIFQHKIKESSLWLLGVGWSWGLWFEGKSWFTTATTTKGRITSSHEIYLQNCYSIKWVGIEV